MKNEKITITWQDVLNEKEDYQWRMVEIPASYSGIERYSNEQSIANNVYYNNEIQEQRTIIYNELLALATTHLTPHQLSVFNYTLEGKLQIEIAELLGNTQSAINKCINGCDDYKNKAINNTTGKLKKYGGIYHKLRNLAKKSEVIVGALCKIQKFKNTNNL